MPTTLESNARWRANFTKATAIVGCIFFIIAAALTPGPDSSFGMAWPVFYCTWGVSMAAALFALSGFLVCRLLDERIGVFYAICPVLVIFAFLVTYFRVDIIRAVLRL